MTVEGEDLLDAIVNGTKVGLPIDPPWLTVPKKYKTRNRIMMHPDFVFKRFSTFTGIVIEWDEDSVTDEMRDYGNMVEHHFADSGQVVQGKEPQDPRETTRMLLNNVRDYTGCFL